METAVNLLIRPPRYEYLPSQLGPTRFAIANTRYKRRDFELVNSRGLKLQCSHWEPADEDRPSKRMGCVIYLHGNSGSRMDAAENVVMLLHSFRLTYFTFDFAGAGHSEGKYISLGYHEQDDVEVVLKYLKSTDAVSNVCLWGRSMGAVTALMYTAKAEERRAKGDEDVMVPSTLILDSPFSSLVKLIPEVVDSVDVKGQYMKQIPKKVVGGLLGLGIPILRKAIKTRRSDTLVRPHHTKLLHEAYGSSIKRRIVVEGGHNTCRGSLCLEEVSSFLFSSFFDEEGRKVVSGLDGQFPRLRVNLDDLGVPHFLCRRLPYPLVKEQVVTFDSLVALAIGHTSVKLQQPFTGKQIGEYKLGSADNDYNVRGYGVEPIGGETDQKLFYLRAGEPFTDTDVILLYLTSRADEISDILKLRIDTLLREKLANVDMASRIEQIVQKLVARRIDEQVALNKRKREREDERLHQRRHPPRQESLECETGGNSGSQSGGAGRSGSGHGREEQPFTFRLRRNTAKLFQAMIGGGGRDDHHSAGATGDVTTTGVTITIGDDEGLRPEAPNEESDNKSKRKEKEKQKEKERERECDGRDAKETNSDEIYVDENDVIGTIEEVLCEIGMVSEKDRPHLHAIISDSVREVIKRELENHRRTERERRERELELNKKEHELGKKRTPRKEENEGEEDNDGKLRRSKTDNGEGDTQQRQIVVDDDRGGRNEATEQYDAEAEGTISEEASGRIASVSGADAGLVHSVSVSNML